MNLLFRISLDFQSIECFRLKKLRVIFQEFVLGNDETFIHTQWYQKAIHVKPKTVILKKVIFKVLKSNIILQFYDTKESRKFATFLNSCQRIQ